MGNDARYWFKGRIMLTNEIKSTLLNFGLEEGKDYETYEINGMEWLTHIFVEASQISWKEDFEDECMRRGIPLQKFQWC